MIQNLIAYQEKQKRELKEWFNSEYAKSYFSKYLSKEHVLQPTEIQYIDKQISSNPQLTLRKLQQEIFKLYNKHYSIQQIKNIVNGLGFHFRKYKLEHNKKLQKSHLDKKCIYIQRFLFFIQNNYLPIFIDEVHFSSLNNNKYRGWICNNKQKTYRFTELIDERRTFIVACSPFKLIHYQIVKGKNNGKIFKDFLKEVLKEIEMQKIEKFFLIMDNVKLHKSKKHKLIDFYITNRIYTLFTIEYDCLYNILDNNIFANIKNKHYQHKYLKR